MAPKVAIVFVSNLVDLVYYHVLFLEVDIGMTAELTDLPPT
jgi:hypothetical protein